MVRAFKTRMATSMQTSAPVKDSCQTPETVEDSGDDSTTTTINDYEVVDDDIYELVDENDDVDNFNKGTRNTIEYYNIFNEDDDSSSEDDSLDDDNWD